MLWPPETPLLGFAELPPLSVRGLGVPQSHQQHPHHHHFYISNIFYHRRIASLVKLFHITFNKIWHGQFRRNYCFKYLAVSHNGLCDFTDESTGVSIPCKINSQPNRFFNIERAYHFQLCSVGSLELPFWEKAIYEQTTRAQEVLQEI